MGTSLREELLNWVRAARGAVAWHLEAGEPALTVPDQYQMPRLGRGEPLPAIRSIAPKPEPTPATPALAVVSEPVVTEVNPPTEIEPPKAQVPDLSLPTFSPESRAAAAGALQIIRDEVGDCSRCHLAQGRNEIVYGWGSPSARVAFIADAPGELEDLLGVPYAGQDGQLLGRMIHAMGLHRGDTYLGYLVMCRARGNALNAEALATCRGFLDRQFAVVRPEVIVALGDLATQALVNAEANLSRVRGQWFEYNGVPVIATFHPGALIQTPAMKGPVWEDLKRVMRRLGLNASNQNPQRG